jgi:hypothetical protein
MKKDDILDVQFVEPSKTAIEFQKPLCFQGNSKPASFGTRIAICVWSLMQSQKYERRQKTHAARDRQ